ncbi:MAG: ferritin family protein [Candidatus Omnitrophota bacterium]|jgi:rubrerythrin
MSEFKRVIDVLEAAVRIERKGVEFYNQLYAVTESSQAKDVFSFLAAEEEKHLGIFREMLEQVTDYQPRYDYPGEYGLFIQGIAVNLFASIEKAEQLLTAKNINQVLDIGIEIEKQTIQFYSELIGQFDLKQKKILQKVIDQEESHQQKLVFLKSKVKF